MRLFKIMIFSLASIVFLTSAKDVKPNKDPLMELKTSIDRLILSVAPKAHVGVKVVSLANGKTFYERNGNQLFVPASNLKMFTAAAALYELGADGSFETQVLTDGEIKNGILRGNLYLKGSGDPDLKLNDLEKLVLHLRLQCINKIEGDLFLDNTAFDGVFQGPGWMWDEGAHYWSAPMDALTVNHSCIDVWVRPRDILEKPPLVFLYPKTSYVQLRNDAITSHDIENLTVERRWLTKENLIEIKGAVAIGSPLKHYSISVEDPALYAGQLFCDLLKKYKINFEGNLLLKETPSSANMLCSHRSPPMRILIQEMMKPSDNLMADCLFKKIGQSRFGAPGTWEKGAQGVREFLQTKAGIDVSELVLLDGCGQSRYNMVSPKQFIDFLTWMHDEFLLFPEFAASLPLSGIDGSLKNRMTDVSTKGKVRAKTGTMTGISSLCGYVTTQDGEELAFTIMVNGFVEPAKNYKMGLEDEICKLLAQFSKGASK